MEGMCWVWLFPLAYLAWWTGEVVGEFFALPVARRVWCVDVKLGVGLLEREGGASDFRGTLGLSDRRSLKCDGERDLERLSAFMGGPSDDGLLVVWHPVTPPIADLS